MIRVAKFCTSNTLSNSEFIRNSTQYLNQLNDKLELQFDDKLDVCFSEGVLTINLPNNRTFVINRQTPNKQLWYSSPISGPARYNYLEGNWRNQNNKVLEEQLMEEINKLFL